jgi:hypothetical protein
MLQDLANQYALIDKADDLHHAAAVRAFEGINFPDFLDAFAPGSRRDFLLRGYCDVQAVVSIGWRINLFFRL